MLYSICSFSSIGAGCVAIVCESGSLHWALVGALWTTCCGCTCDCQMSLSNWIHCWMQVVYCDNCVDVSRVHCWAKNVRMAQWEIADWCDKQWSGWPVPAAGGFHEKKFDELIKNNWQTAEREIAVQLDSSQERVGKIIDVLPYHTVCARWVPAC